jgi:hypothetical protein
MKVDQNLAKLVIAKSLPLSFVEGEEIDDFVKSLDLKYDLPGIGKLRNKLIPSNVERIKSNIKKILQGLKKINISSDIWSEPSLRAFIAFGAHGITEEWKLIKCILGVKRLLGSHTNAIIYKEFLELAKEFNIENKLYKIITDGGSNMVKAFDNTHLEEFCSLFDELLESELETEKDLNDINEQEEEIDDDEIISIMEEIDTVEIVKSICRSNS